MLVVVWQAPSKTMADTIRDPMEAQIWIFLIGGKILARFISVIIEDSRKDSSLFWRSAAIRERTTTESATEWCDRANHRKTVP